jgi:hypothetical protein
MLTRLHAAASSPLSFCMERWLIQEPISTTQTKHTTKTEPITETKGFYAPFPFFDLPRVSCQSLRVLNMCLTLLPQELRDMLYDKVWPETSCKSINMLSPSARVDIYTAYRPPNQVYLCNSYLSYWSLVSKKFLREAMAQYFQKVDWHANVPSSHFSTPLFLSNSRSAPIRSILLEEEIRYAFANRKIHRDAESNNYTRKPLRVIDSSPTTLSIKKEIAAKSR